ncbi:M20/M25/M40 family metallo-hydrolase [Niallia circulans]|uniref:M20/M25/M40 family metallo-hydrolase n=1 Tax=Niallia circulans TaxID=1397 RepID=UPI0026F1139F|nr:M20/M25/M40 family metallo-hydrolase [Niallia circulans]
MTNVEHKTEEFTEMVKQVYKLLAENEQVQKALEFLEEDNEATTKEQIELTEIEAPTFEEKEKGEWYKKRLESLGVQKVTTDEVGNVFGVLPGNGNGASLVVCAHLDTVFPKGTNVKAVRENGLIYAPGICDDGRGLAVVLTIIRALALAGIKTEGDLIIGATVGEEGLGDLRGVKSLFENRQDIDGFISIEPGNPSRITYLGTGSKRFNVLFKGPGGHSFGNFGIPSPIHALGRAIAKISDLATPVEPKTTFNVGMIKGGTSVNTIAETAEMLVDLRSNSQEELEIIESKFLYLMEQAKEEENARWNVEAQVSLQIEKVGDRPAGSQDKNSVIVQAARCATAALGFEPILDQASSTDSNVPIHLGIPALTLGGGGEGGGFHTLQEYYNPSDAHIGAQKILLTILGLVGLEQVTAPLLEKGK